LIMSRRWSSCHLPSPFARLMKSFQNRISPKLIRRKMPVGRKV
jgi:hypothetical protein